MNGASASNDDLWFGTASLNFYYDIGRYAVGESVALTPYAGVGVGAAGGFVRADALLSGVLRRDDRNDIGAAGRANVGVLIELSESLGLSVGYDFLGADVGDDSVYIHSGEVGLRWTF